jgi:hypothetical protein
MSEYLNLEPETEHPKRFEVREGKVSDGTIYDIYFPSVEAMDEALREFWLTADPGIVTPSISRGMLKPLEHEIVSGDRTVPITNLSEHERSEHPGMVCKFHINGNTSGVTSRGMRALKKLGYI